MGGICAADFTCSTARYVQNRKRSAGTAAYWAVAWFPLSGERAHNYIDKPWAGLSVIPINLIDVGISEAR